MPEHDNDRSTSSESDEQRLIREARETEDLERFRARVALRRQDIEAIKERWSPHHRSAWRNLIWLGLAFLIIATLMIIGYFFW